MSEAKDDFAIGEELTADQINANAENINDAGGFRDDLKAGETIAGATLPVPVYQDVSDNKLYACDANDDTKLEFIGFVTSDADDTEAIDFQGSGIVRGFTGLTEGVKYYVQDDKTIGITPGTYNILVGIAISATELLIKKSSQFFTDDLGSSTSGLISSTQNLIKTANCPFVPRYFECIVALDISAGKTWDESENAAFILTSARIKGIILGTIVKATVDYTGTGEHPSNNPSLNPYGDANRFVNDADYGEATCASPAITSGLLASYGTFALASITTSGNDLIFTFTYTHVGNSSDCRYAIRQLIVSE